MPSVAYVGEILEDGHLSLPESIRNRLGVRTGRRVEVVIRPHTEEEPAGDKEAPPPEAYEPLRELIGMAKIGREDASVNHDKYLYQEDPT